MERFGDGLKTASKAPAVQKLEAICENSPLTWVPTERMTLNAAMEMKNAIMAYSMAAAPL